ncbi:hypothetical protein D3C80_1814770 [compost metagenome]
MGCLVPGDTPRVAHFHDLTQGSHVGKKVDEVAPHHPRCRQQAFDDAVVTGHEPPTLEQPVDQQKAVEPQQRRKQYAVGQDRGETPGTG